MPHVHVHASRNFWVHQQTKHTGGCALEHSHIAEVVVAVLLTVQGQPGGAGPHSLVAEAVHVELRRLHGLSRGHRLQPNPE